MLTNLAQWQRLRRINMEFRQYRITSDMFRIDPETADIPDAYIDQNDPLIQQFSHQTVPPSNILQKNLADK